MYSNIIMCYSNDDNLMIHPMKYQESDSIGEFLLIITKSFGEGLPLPFGLHSEAASAYNS